MRLMMTDAEVMAMCREVHGMFHAGATEAEGLERLRTRMTRGQYDKLPRLLRPVFNRYVKMCLGYMWGPEHCGPDHEVVICHEPPAV